MTLEEYAAWVKSVWSTRRNSKNYPTLKDKFIMSVGLAGETGEVLELLKKEVRDDKLNKKDLVLELGDVLYYWCMICDSQDIDIQEVMEHNMIKLIDRRKNGKKH